jgi:chromosome segregation ATPase
VQAAQAQAAQSARQQVEGAEAAAARRVAEAEGRAREAGARAEAAEKGIFKLQAEFERAEQASLARIDEVHQTAMAKTKEVSQLAIAAVGDARKLEDARKGAEATRVQIMVDQERRKMEDAQECLRASAASARSLEEALAAKQRELEKLRLDFESSQRELGDARLEAEALLEAGRQVVSELDTTAQSAALERTEASKTIGRLREAFEEKMSAAQKELFVQRNSRKDEAELRQRELAEAHGERERLQGDLEKLQSDLEKRRQESVAWDARDAMLTTRVERLTAELKNAWAKVDEVQVAFQSARAEIEAHVVRAHSMEQKLAQTESNWQRAQRNLEESSAKLQALLGQHEDAVLAHVEATATAAATYEAGKTAALAVHAEDLAQMSAAHAAREQTTAAAHAAAVAEHERRHAQASDQAAALSSRPKMTDSNDSKTTL